ncbi:putative ribonuclease H-like domain-containing protein [Tanacetum coccineum]
MDLETAQTNTTTKLPLLKQGPVAADEKTQKKNDVKARSMLLMALLNDHLLTFNQYKDVKTFLVKETTNSSLNSSSQNLAFMLSTSSTNEVNTAYRVSTANTQVSTASTQVSTANLSDDTVYAFLASQPNGSQLVHEDLEQIHEDDLEEMDLKWQLALLSMRTRKFFQKTGRKITINGSDTAGYDKSKVECFNCHKLGHFARECRGPRNQDNMSRNQDSSRRTINVEEISSKAMLAIDGAGFDWSFMADEEVPTDITLMAFSNSELEKLKHEKESNQLKIENFDNAPKSLDKLIRSQIPNKSRKGLGFINYNGVPPPPTGLFSPLTLDLSNSSLEEFQQLEFERYGPKTSKSVSEDTSNEVRESPDASLVEELMSNDKLEKKTIFPTVTKINFGHPQKEDQGYVDSGCSRHMTGNMSYLSDFKEFDGGYVTFGGRAKGGRITGKGTLKIGKLDFEDVLLKVLRKNNMYSVDMKNIVPKESLTCLVAKDTLDELMLWYRRLGHVNFKTINKLVKDNHVKGLPIKHFENDQTYVACLKGKQHKASCHSSKEKDLSQVKLSMRMEQYLTHTDYALWEVIMNGDAPASAGTEGHIPPKTAKQKLARKNELKDAKTLWEAIKARFGGNKESKKMQKTILKRQYENFAASRSEGLYKTYDRFQKLIRQLEIHGEVISQEDANLKLLRSLHHNLEQYSFNHRNKGQASSLTYADDVMFSFFVNQSNSQQLDNEDLEQIDTDDLEEMITMHERSLCARDAWAPRNQGNRNGDGPRRNAPVDTSTTNALVVQDGIGGYDWSFQAKEGITNFSLMAYTSQGSSSSSSSDSEVHTCSKDCLKSYETLQKQNDQQREAFNKSNLEIIGYQIGLESLEARIVVHEKNEVVYEEDIAFLKYDVQVKDISIKDLKNQLEGALKEKDDLKLKLENFEESSKNLTKLINSQISAKDKAGLGYDSQMNKSEVVHSMFNSRESDVDNSPVNDRFKTGEGFHAVPLLHRTTCLKPSAPIIEDWDIDSDNNSVFRPKTDQKKPKFTKINFVKSDENVKSVKKENIHKQVEYPRKSQSPRGNRRNWNGMMTQKPGNEHSPLRRDFNQKSAAKTYNLNEKVKTDRVNNVTTAGPKAVVSAAVGYGENTVKSSACWIWRPTENVIDHTSKDSGSYMFKRFDYGNPHYTLQDQGIFDSGCFRHMTGNKSFLTNYQEVDGRFVALVGSPKGGKIIRKGNIRTRKLDFEDVYFVKELKFNLLSILQMCDKKNRVLFTKTKCLVLSPDFKLLDESQVLLKVPRHNNMYSFDLKNVVPLGGLTCLFSKATVDESNLWHWRLGHINFKTMNKLVKGNLVRGLPSKLFKNNHSCVACQKGKRHKASCKTKLVSSISQPLQMLHMDLFGPTSVRSINHKIYCLVVTDDYSRFSWVFFLATKDETSGILKTFITGIENQINHKVKIIRCDNGTKFKNNDMNQFCGMKGIKREFSVARTPQQNRVAERKNRTLIEAARTMLADSLLPTTFWAEAVSTACYVQNRVLVTKPHNKTPYELLHGRPPSISFMRPFGCPVTILNTLDPLGKFDEKADEGFFIGYSINSKAFRVFNTRTRKVKENLHINFLEKKPNVVGNGPDWLFDIDLLTNSITYEPVSTGNQTDKNAGIKDNFDAVPTQQYILLPLVYGSPQSSKDVVADDAGKKTNEEPANEGEINGQEKEGGASNKEDDQNVQDFRAALDNFFTNADDLSTAPLMPDLEDTTDLVNTSIFSGAYNDEDFLQHILDLYFKYFKLSEDVVNRILQFILDLQCFKSSLFNLCSNYSSKLFSNPSGNVMQRDDGIFISQDKYMADILKKFDFVTVKAASTPIETNKALNKDEEAEDVNVYLYRLMIGSLIDSPFDLEAFSDSDYAGASLAKKST